MAAVASIIIEADESGSVAATNKLTSSIDQLNASINRVGVKSKPVCDVALCRNPQAANRVEPLPEREQLCLAKTLLRSAWSALDSVRFVRHFRLETGLLFTPTRLMLAFSWSIDDVSLFVAATDPLSSASIIMEATAAI